MGYIRDEQHEVDTLPGAEFFLIRTAILPLLLVGSLVGVSLLPVGVPYTLILAAVLFVIAAGMWKFLKGKENE